MPLFRKTAPEDPLIISMTGVRLGLRVLIVVGEAVDVPLDVGARVGLTGQASVLAPTQAMVTRVADAARRKGVLLEPTLLEIPLSHGDAAFDLVVVDEQSGSSGGQTEVALFREARRTLRTGGRIVVIRPASRRSGFFTRRSEETDTEQHELFERLRAAGFRAARSIGTCGGSTFIEAARPA
jgi:hypothetical protein